MKSQMRIVRCLIAVTIFIIGFVPGTAHAETFYTLSGKVLFPTEFAPLKDNFTSVQVMAQPSRITATVSADGSYSMTIPESTSQVILFLTPTGSSDPYVFNKSVKVNGNTFLDVELPKVRLLEIKLVDAQKSPLIRTSTNNISPTLTLGPRNFLISIPGSTSNNVMQAGNLTFGSSTGTFRIFAFQANERSSLDGAPIANAWATNLIALSYEIIGAGGANGKFLIDSGDTTKNIYTICTPVNVVAGQPFPGKECESDQNLVARSDAYYQKLKDETKIWMDKENGISTKPQIAKRIVTITCIKGKTVKKVSSTAPNCPSGYTLKK